MSKNRDTEGNPSPQVRKRRPELIVGGLIFLAAAGYFSYGLVSSYVQQLRASHTFVPVPAKVVRAEVATRGGPRSSQGPMFSPLIVYHYTVNGRGYEGTRYFFTGSGWVDYAAAKSAIDRFPVNSTVEAYYDPKDPAEAVLDRKEPDPESLWFIVPFWVFGLLVVIVGLLGKRKS